LERIKNEFYFYIKIIMSSIDDIKKLIIIKVEKLILENLIIFFKRNKISSSLIGIEIAKIINNEIKDYRNNIKLKSAINNNNNDIKINKDERKKEYYIFMRKTLEILKKENEQKEDKYKKNILEIFENAYNKWLKEIKNDFYL